MSLLRESVAQVLQADVLYIKGDTQETKWNDAQLHNFKGYNVITGVMAPRGNNSYLFVDNVTELPIQLPPNSIPVFTLLVPITPLVSTNLVTSTLQFYMFDDESFSNSVEPWGSLYGTHTGAEINSKAYFENSYTQGSLSDYVGYPYFGVETSGPAFTDGSFQMYMYYITK